MQKSKLPPAVTNLLCGGTVIPAMPLALNADRKLSERHQRALVKYYMACGVGGVAAGVHTTQFQIRDPKIGLFKPVLKLVAETMDEAATPHVKVCGVCGKTPQALAEAEFAEETGYHAVLLSLAAMKDATVPEMVEHCRRVSEVMPLIGFYLQPAVGGRPLPYEFWRGFAEIPNVVAIKMAPFNRYQTLDVIRAVADTGRDDITLYTGNDDNIVMDLVTPYRIVTAKGTRIMRIRGGLLGHWSVWVKRAVELFDECRRAADGDVIPISLLQRAIEVTDCNAAFFDTAHAFRGCIAGLHYVLHRQGLLPGIWCLDPNESLSPGQAEEIARVQTSYPHLNDDAFVAQHLPEWLN